jgi:hypothetical protein
LSPETSLAEVDIRGGDRLTLFENRLVLTGNDAVESVALVHLASVRVTFERDPLKLNWALGLLVGAAALAAVAPPLQRWIAGAAAKFGDSARAESLDSVLHGVFHALGALASLLPAIAAALAAGALALLAFFWIGRTTLTLAFAATERVCPVRGRDRRLFEFAEALGERLAARRG